MDLVFDPYTGKMVDRRTGLPVETNGTAPGRVNALESIFAGTGIPERAAVLNSLFNPVTALQEAGQHSQNMLAPDRAWTQRVSDAGQMLTGMAGTVAPMWAASRGAMPATNALVDGLTGFAPTGAPEFLADEFGGVKLPGKDGIKAYHGSPHSFDRFSMDKIGTGEGAQAYGHGLYFAENEQVAQNYRAALKLKGYDGASEADALRAAGFSDSDLRQLTPFIDTSIDADAALSSFTDWTGRKATPEMREAVKAVFDARPKGSMYEVRINANPDDFLDWDKPLSEQPAGARLVADFERTRQELLAGLPEIDGTIPLSEYDAKYGSTLDEAARLRVKPEWTGAQFYESNRLVPGDYRDPSAATAALRERGIPGIKYLDAGSRGAGDGSRNYVVFDEKLIEIVRKYGIAGAAAMLGVSAMDVEQAMAGQR